MCKQVMSVMVKKETIYKGNNGTTDCVPKPLANIMPVCICKFFLSHFNMMQ